MKLDVNVYHHNNDINEKLDIILNLLELIQRKEDQMSVELDALEAAVAENTSLDNSIIEFCKGLAAQIEAAKTDPVKLQELAASLKASSAAISEAIIAKTPAEV